MKINPSDSGTSGSKSGIFDLILEKNYLVFVWTLNSMGHDIYTHLYFQDFLQVLTALLKASSSFIKARLSVAHIQAPNTINSKISLSEL